MFAKSKGQETRSLSVPFASCEFLVSTFIAHLSSNGLKNVFLLYELLRNTIRIEITN